MNVLLVCMGQSPYNRSIWSGFSRAFSRLGCAVQEVDARALPEPAELSGLPGLLFAVHGGNVPVEPIGRYRAAGVATAVYLLDEPYEVDRSVGWARHYDWVFSVDRATVPIHQAHANAAHLPLGYDDQVFRPEGAAIESEILVLGSPFAAREAFLRPVRDRWGARVTWVGPAGWRQFSPAGRHVERYVTPEECAQFYRGARITLNIHRDSCWSHFGDLNHRRIQATHLNPRFWEAAGCGGFPLCNHRPDLDRYAPRTPSFRSAGELEQKLEYFLDNETARRKVAQRLLKSVQGHSYVERARVVLEAVGGI